MNEIWWFLLGILFLIGEIVGRGYLLLSLGFASIIAGLISLRFLNPFIQVIAFALLTAILFTLSRKYAGRFFIAKSGSAKKQPTGG